MKLKDLIGILKNELRAHGNVEVRGNWCMVSGSVLLEGYTLSIVPDDNAKKAAADSSAQKDIRQLQWEVAKLKDELEHLHRIIPVPDDDPKIKAEFKKMEQQLFTSWRSHQDGWTSVSCAKPSYGKLVLVKVSSLPYGVGLGIYRGEIPGWLICDLDGRIFDGCHLQFQTKLVEYWKYIPIS